MHPESHRGRIRWRRAHARLRRGLERVSVALQDRLGLGVALVGYALKR
jgi:hypothetical protein